MRNRRQQLYTCLTLFKQDIREIIQLFQNNLQDVEIFIDDLRILDITQLDQFDPTYQAKSLLVQGYDYGMVEDSAKHQNMRPSIELRMGKAQAVLIVRKEAGQANPKVFVQIRKFLSRCQNHIHQLMVSVGSGLFIYLFVSIVPALEHHNVNFIMIMLLLPASSVSLTFAANFLYAFIVKRLKIETLIFLLPGRMKTNQVYGRREAVGRLIVALVVSIVFAITLVFALHTLWR